MGVYKKHALLGEFDYVVTPCAALDADYILPKG
jgi:hypothetical protein